jgi:molybdopterin-containing oxidoreductase family membrane subunit
MSAIYGLYETPAAAQRAVDSLRSAGVDDARITIISGEPFEEYEFAHRDHSTWMWYIAAAGGVAGLVIATWLTSFTELAWPLPTGNMPIVAWWPNLIVIFELTMLGGILAAVATLLVAAKLPAKKPRLYDPAVMDGKILVGVSEAPNDTTVERALAEGEVRRA